jgi:hypothetical protein
MRLVYLGLAVRDELDLVSTKVRDPDGYLVELYWESLAG